MKMQINTPPELAAKIAIFSARMISAGIMRQQARPGKIYARLVEYGQKEYLAGKCRIRPDYLDGGSQNQVEFTVETIQAVWRVAGILNINRKQAANACAWWGITAFTAWLEELEASYVPKPTRKVGRPRKVTQDI